MLWRLRGRTGLQAGDIGIVREFIASVMRAVGGRVPARRRRECRRRRRGKGARGKGQGQ